MPDRVSTLPRTLEALAGSYLDFPRVCLLCRAAPASMALVYLADATGDGKRRGCVFAVCVPCRCADDLQARVGAALRKAHAPEMGAWN
jgi:hypothetical protein